MKDLLTAILAVLFVVIVYVIAIELVKHQLKKDNNVLTEQSKQDKFSGEPTL